jgi:putative NADH-flavin reductase
LRITIFGGTGPTGLLLVEQALARGHDVVAFARTPSKLPPHERLSVVEGELNDSEKISAAIAGSEAVLSLLGPGTNAADVPPLVTGTRNIVAAMHAHGVRRLVATATPSMSDDADGKDWRIGLLVKLISRFQPVAYDAIVTIGRIVRESELDWTIVRLPFLSNGPRTDRINARQVGKKGGLRLSRANGAAFVLEQATDPAYLYMAPFISDT